MRLAALLCGATLAVAPVPCRDENRHDGMTNILFRANPALEPVSVGVPASIRFALEYLNRRGGQWRPLSWSQLEKAHEARIHAYILSDDGRSYYHLHGQPASDVRVGEAYGEVHSTIGFSLDVTLQRPGRYLVVVSWVVEASALGICTTEGVMHAHGISSNAIEYPMLMDRACKCNSNHRTCALIPLRTTRSSDEALMRLAEWTVEATGERASQQPQRLPRFHTLSCPQEASLVQSGDLEGEYAFDGAFTVERLVDRTAADDCCCDAARRGEAASSHCASRCPMLRDCIVVEVTARSIERWLPESERPASGSASERVFRSGECIGLEMHVREALTGRPVNDLAPHLGAASHVFVASLVGEAASSTSFASQAAMDSVSMAAHAHAYPESIDWYDQRRVFRYNEGAQVLHNVLCEDAKYDAVVPPPQLPESFGPSLWAMVRLPMADRWFFHPTSRPPLTLVTYA